MQRSILDRYRANSIFAMDVPIFKKRTPYSGKLPPSVPYIDNLQDRGADCTSASFSSSTITSCVITNTDFASWNLITTVKPQWLEHRWLVYRHDGGQFELVFECLENSSDSSRKQIFTSIYEVFLFYHENVWCVFSLKSPHRGDFNEYTQHTIIL